VPSAAVAGNRDAVSVMTPGARCCGDAISLEDFKGGLTAASGSGGGLGTWRLGGDEDRTGRDPIADNTMSSEAPHSSSSSPSPPFVWYFPTVTLNAGGGSEGTATPDAVGA
jgi:hypothetical protein